MFPSIRLGFVVPPRWAIGPMVAAKNAIDWHCPVPLQIAVASFILDGHLARHVRRVRRLYRERRKHLLDLLKHRLGGTFEVVPSYYGMHVAILANGDLDCAAIADALAERGVAIHSLDRYFMGPVAEAGFVISYAVADGATIDLAIAALAEETLRIEASDVRFESGSRKSHRIGP
jgi:GntR family transcriptional regulator/MocR family aminotransferase